MVKFAMALFWAALVAKHHTRAFSSAGIARATTKLPSRVLSSLVPATSSKAYRSSTHSRLFSTSVDLDELNEKIKNKGDEIRQLKSDGIDKAGLATYIQELLALKAQLPPDESAAPPPKKEKAKQPQKQKKAPPKKVEDMSESELRLNRLAKVNAMREANIEPFAYSFDATRSAAQLSAEYEGRLEGGEEDEESDVAVAGRIMTRRVFGKLAFFTLQDESGTIQLQFDKQRLGDAFKVRQCFEQLRLVSILVSNYFFVFSGYQRLY
jgi:hypothetical protein